MRMKSTFQFSFLCGKQYKIKLRVFWPYTSAFHIFPIRDVVSTFFVLFYFYYKLIDSFSDIFSKNIEKHIFQSTSALLILGYYIHPSSFLRKIINCLEHAVTRYILINVILMRKFNKKCKLLFFFVCILYIYMFE